ncbi:MAG: Ig-like domain-containing protein, partial [Verrucomicrobia bacterium]|nr:Ig-like domain-containing protein [Verrucomicrobiota bacterium]
MNRILLSVLSCWFVLATAVAQDTTPPALVSTGSIESGFVVGVCFNEALDAASAEDIANYTLPIEVVAAALRPDGQSVSLFTDGGLPRDFTVTVRGIKDAAGNTIAAESNVAGTSHTELLETQLGAGSGASQAFSCNFGDIDVDVFGGPIDGVLDDFFLVSGLRTGNFDVRVQVAAITSNNAAGHSGIMARAEATDDSPHVIVSVLGDGRLWARYRGAPLDGVATATATWTENGGTGTSASGFPDKWVRLTRLGNQFAGFHSADGETWTRFAVLNAPFLEETVELGLATSDIGATQYRNFTDFAYADPSIVVNVAPADTEVVQNRKATFSVVATPRSGDTDLSVGELAYQWQKNGEDIPGATLDTYTTPIVPMSDSGAQYRCVLTMWDGTTVTSEAGTLTVTADGTAPTLVSHIFSGGATLLVTLEFDELMDPATLETLANYVFTGGPTVTGATTVPDADGNTTTVVINIDGLPQNTAYSFTVQGVTDLAGNAIAATPLSGDSGFFEINLARGGTATMSTFDPNYPPDLAIDGNTNG